jgi:hypothetical protein
MVQLFDYRIKMGPFYGYEFGILISDHLNTRLKFVGCADSSIQVPTVFKKPQKGLDIEWYSHVVIILR